jgi:hypothetical protein
MPSFYPQNRERILEESKFRKNSLAYETFYSDARTDKILSDPDAYFFEPEPGSQIVTKYFINNAVYASHIIGKNLSYFHSYTNLIKDNYLNYFDGTYKAHLFNQRIIQNQYYGSLNFFTATGWVFSPSFHFLTSGYKQLSISTTGMNPSAITYNVRSNGYYAGIAITKSLGFVVISAESGYVNLNSTKLLQGTVSLMVYPAGNSTFFLGGKLSTAKELQVSTADLNLAGGFTAGFSIAGKVWFEFSGLTGDLNNYADNNGLYVYNSIDILKKKLSGRIIIPFYKAGLSVFAGGGLSSYSSKFITDDGLVSDFGNSINYNNKNYTGGILWKF